MTLYLKYRPKNLDELDLLDVGESLKKILQSESIPHAFLFSGPKGTGKTSAARILAKIIDCENLGKDLIPCDKCEQCKTITKGNNLDVVEMDAASHRGIDDIRSLRDAVKLAPTSAKKKIYIIDEAHMLTTEASNALLKTLEEPPEHVIFVLATTNPEKLIETIRSRTTLIPFRKASTEEIARSLKRVIENEKIKITDETVAKIAEISGGAFRDAIKILEQISLEGESYLEKFKNSELQNFLNALVKKDLKRAIEEIENGVSRGLSLDFFLKDLLQTFHDAMLGEVGLGENRIKGLNKDDLVTLVELFSEANVDLATSPIEVLPIEIAIFKWCGEEKYEVRIEPPNEIKDINPKKSESAPVEEIVDNKTEEVRNNDMSDVVINPQNSPLDVQYSSINDDIWKNILLAVRPINASIEGLLRSSKPVTYDGKTLTLGVYYKFHKERLEDIHHRKVLEDVIAKILNTPTRVVCTLVEPPPKKIIAESVHEPVLTETRDADIIKIAEDIFSN